MSDYLWDKEGRDPEIEALELKLGAFAYAPLPDPLPASQGEGDYVWDRSGADEGVALLEVSLGSLAYDGDPPVLPLQRVKRPISSGAPWKHSKLMPLALAAGLTLVSLAVGWSALTREDTEARQGWELVPVLVANTELPAGTVVTPQVVSQRAVPARFVSASVLRPESASIVLGQKVTVAVSAGDPLLWDQFESARAFEHLAARIVRGARALAVEVDGKTGVGAWLRPDDHVDIIASLIDPNTNQKVAVTLMENVKVLAARERENVALMVLPEEAELLAFAREFGDVTFTLRHGDDQALREGRGKAFGERERVLLQKRFETIQVIRGAQVPREKP
jgi:pilus assembly protein CpaB